MSNLTTFEMEEKIDHKKRLEKAKQQWRLDIAEKGFTKKTYKYKTLAKIN